MRFSNNVEHRLCARHKKGLSIVSYKNKSVLDIGCSFGWFEKLADAREIWGVEPNVTDLENAKQNNFNKKNVRFMQGNIFELNKIRKKFDIAVMFDVLEHLPRKKEEEALKKIRKILKDKGRLVISTPAENFSKFLDPAWYFGHRHYSEKEIVNLLKNSGFRVKEISYGGGFFESISMILFYVYKWLFNSEIPFKKWFDKKREEEYLKNKNAFVTMFVVADIEKNDL